MKKIIITMLVILGLVMTTESAMANESEYAGITKNQKIISALNILKETKNNWVVKAVKGHNISQRPIRVMFRNLGKMNPSYNTHEALTCLDSTDKIYIFINTKHKEAPVEAIAALLVHEAHHQDANNSILEETAAWTSEAVAWRELKRKNPSLTDKSLNQHLLVKRLNKLQSIYNAGGKKAIQNKVASIKAYENLEMASAGFDY